MRRFCYILMAALLTLAGCTRMEELVPGEKVPAGERVNISFDVAIPDDGTGTKAMGINPTIDPDGFYVAVFGGSGYFNEWVKATVVSATANYNGTAATRYTLTATLSISDSRLRLHFIANCPTQYRSSPPISGSQDTEEYVMDKIRSKRTESYNDGYWQKIILPNGIRVNKQGNTYVATPATLAQFPSPIVMVRNFARVYLRNLTPIVGTQGVNEHQLVTIKKFGLAYAPAEGVIAPIMSAPFTSNQWGHPITVADNDDTTPIYYENFLLNYQNYPIESENQSDTLLTGPPFNYAGYSPSDQSYDYYPASGHTDRSVPVLSDLQTWSNTAEDNVVFVYERTIPSADHRATRIIILAERVDQNDVSEGDKYYALDIVNSNGVAIPLLRNQSYTVHLLNIEAGSGETDISKAAKATSATVSGDPSFQDLINISDGKSSIGTSFTEKFYVRPQEDYVMFRYIPTNVTDDNYEANQEGNELVTISVGSVDTHTGVFTELTPSQASSQGILAFKTEGSQYKVWIDKNGNDVVQYVRANNDWVVATQAQIDNPEEEKWGKVKYQLSESYKDSDGYFSEERAQAIHITGSYNTREMSRNVIIKTSPRQSIRVNCLQKYVEAQSGQQETVRIMIPTGLSRSVFPLEFTIEPDGYSLTPNGDGLPVDYGTSTIPGHSEPSFFFVKTLTQADYNSLPTVQTEEGGKTLTWKYFDCHFKTTIADNACTVYVQNEYFDDDDAHDEFFNYQQRLFTSLTLPNTVYRHGNATFSFVMDYAHYGNTLVWWDPTNSQNQSANAAQAEAKGLSTSNRVLPLILTVELNGFTPQYQSDGVTPVTSGLEHKSGNTYWYYVGTGAPNSTMTSPSLALTATGAIGSTASVSLSTVNIDDNPTLYAPETSSSVTIQGARFTGLSFSPSELPLGLGKTTDFSFTYVSGLVVPITIHLDNLTIDSSDTRIQDNGNGNYTFTPDNSNVTQTITLKSTTRFSSGTVTLSHEDYETNSASISRPQWFEIAAGKLRAGTRRPYSNTTGVYPYISDSYSTSANSSYNQYYTNFNTSSPYASQYALRLDLSKWGSDVEDGVVYFRYNGYDSSRDVYDYHYASVSLADLCDAIYPEDPNDAVPYTLNFKVWTTTSVTFTAASDNYQWNGVSWSTSGNNILSMYFSNNTGVKSGNSYYIRIGSDSASGSIYITTENSTLEGCKLTGATITYRGNNYDDCSVTASPGSMSSNRKTWTASSTATGNGDGNVTITMAKGNTPNQISSIQINYGYWE